MSDLHCPNCNIRFRKPEDQTAHSRSDIYECPSCHSEVNDDGLATRTFDQKEGMTFGRYSVIALLGRGSFGSVYRAMDTKLEREVALKIAHPNNPNVTDMLQEARAAAGISHANVVGIFDVGQVNQFPYISMELIQAGTLADWARTHKGDHIAVARIMWKLCQAMHAAHTKGVIHHDLKPRNILLDRGTEPKVTDFGLAGKCAIAGTGPSDDQNVEETATESGRVVGTPAYMSPEQSAGVKKLTGSTDIYSLGVIFYELLCGKRPFYGTSSQTLLYRIQHEEPPRPRLLDPTIPVDLETLCLKALQKKPEDRFLSMDVFASELALFLDDKPIQTRPRTLLEKIVRQVKKNPVFYLLTTAVIVLVLVIALWPPQEGRPVIVHRDRDPEPKLTHLVKIPPVGRANVRDLLGKPVQANWAIVPRDKTTGLPVLEKALQFKSQSELEVRLEPGEYFIEVEIPGFGSQRVLRYVPKNPAGIPRAHPHNHWEMVNGAVLFPEITVHPTEAVVQNMALVQGGEFLAGGSDGISPLQKQKIPSFYMDETEVTVAEFTKVFPLPSLYDGKTPSPQEPIVGVDWNTAMAYAEAVGKRLPHEFEYEFAATNAGDTKVPWGDDLSLVTSWQIQDVKSYTYDVTLDGQIWGLFSNAAEWTEGPLYILKGSPHLERLELTEDEMVSSVVVRGGPTDGDDQNHIEIQAGAAARPGMAKSATSPHIGFRCVRSLQPELITPAN